MKSKFFLIATVILLAFYNTAYGQSCNWARASVGNDWSIAYDMTHDSNNNLYACGFFIDSIRFGNLDGYGDSQTGFIVKYDATGNAEWLLTLPTNAGFSEWSFAEKIVTDLHDDIIVCGWFRGTFNVGTFQLSSSSQNLFLIKLDASGNVKWATQTNDPTNDYFRMFLTTDVDNNIYVASYNIDSTQFGSLSANKEGYFITKYDSSGSPVMLINESNCRLYSINVGINKNIFITSSVYDTTIVGTDTIIPGGYYDYIIIGIDTDTVYVQQSDLLIVCYDSLANVVWTRQALNKTENYDSFSALDMNSNLYVAGVIDDTTDFWGTVIPSSTSAPSTFVIKIAPSGIFLWNKLSSPSSNGGRLTPFDIKIKNNHLFLAGQKYDTCTFMNVYFNSQNSFGFILYSDTAGNGFRNIFDTTNIWTHQIWGISIDNSGNVGLCGYFEDSLILCDDHLSSFENSALNFFVASTTTSPLSVEEFNLSNDWVVDVFPNPSTGKFTLKSKKRINQINIFSSTGQLINEISFNKPVNDFHFTLDKSGFYYLNVISDKEIVVKKIVVVSE